MKLLLRFLFLVLVLSASVFYFLYPDGQTSTNVRNNSTSSSSTISQAADQGQGLLAALMAPRLELEAQVKGSKEEEVVLAVVACGDRLDETLAMLKSALVFTQAPIRFIIFADDDLIESFSEKLKEWNTIQGISFKFEVRSIQFPFEDKKDEWKKLFKPCASQRLFLPSVLSDVDSLLYVDTDTLFLTPLEEIWRHLSLFNSSQMAALTPEHEDRATGWYNRFARHPYYGPLGVNSGVMLMNLTRMRAFGWIDYVLPIYQEYKLKITWGDQDIINILFHFHSDKLYIYPCRYNYRPDHCMYMSVCESADKEGVAVLHGNRGSFHSEKQPAFRAVYRAMEEYQLDSDPFNNFLLPMKHYLDQTANTNCGKVRRIFLKSAEQYINEIYD